MAALLRSGIVLGCLIFSIAGLAQTAAPTKSCTGAGPSKGTVKSRCARVMCVCASPPRSATAYKNAVTLIEGRVQQVDRTRLEVIHYRGGGMSVSSPHAALRRSFQITNAQYNGVVYSSDLLMYPDTCAISDGKGCPAVIVGDEISIQWWQEFSSSIWLADIGVSGCRTRAGIHLHRTHGERRRCAMVLDGSAGTRAHRE